MSVESSQKPDNLPTETSKSQTISPFDFELFDFELWSSQVRRQMIASLKKRTLIYGDFWASSSRAAKAEQKPAPELEN